MQEYIDFVGRNPLLCAAWAGLAGTLIYSTLRSLTSPITYVSAAEATLLINRQDALIVDIRSQDAFAKQHIIKATSIPLAQIEANRWPALEGCTDKPLIVVCESGLTAEKAANVLTKAGFNAVSVLSGGLTQWQADNLPLTQKR